MSSLMADLFANLASMNRPIITAEFLLSSGSHPISILIGYWVDGSIMDEDLALLLELQVELSARALDWCLMWQVNNKSSSLQILLPVGPQ